MRGKKTVWVFSHRLHFDLDSRKMQTVFFDDLDLIPGDIGSEYDWIISCAPLAFLPSFRHLCPVKLQQIGEQGEKRLLILYLLLYDRKAE